MLLAADRYIYTKIRLFICETFIEALISARFCIRRVYPEVSSRALDLGSLTK